MNKTINLSILITLLLIGTTFSQTATQSTLRGTDHWLYLPKMGVEAPLTHHGDYSLAYSEEHEQAYWISYELTKDEVLGSAKRKDNFREDPKIPSKSASLADYKNSGYDRGHLKPAADSKEDALEMSESFYMSNISPQNQGFNRGIWKELEELVRGWSVLEDTIHVITGPVLQAFSGRDNIPKKTIGENKVTVPTHYYKIVLDLTNKPKAIAFLMPNRSSSNPLVNFTVTIDSLEALTGINFFHELPDDLENRLEGSVQSNKWSFRTQNESSDGSKATSLPNNGVDHTFSINKKSGVRHNSSCKAYNCKNCTPSSGSKGRPCGICGG